MTQGFILPGPPVCPSCGGARRADDPLCLACSAGQVASARPVFFALPAMRYPGAYTWIVFLATLDIILTYIVLYVWDGHEVNPVAAYVIESRGFNAAILFKYALVLFAIVFCEFVGRLRERDGRRLAAALLVLGALPVIYTFALLLLHPDGPPLP